MISAFEHIQADNFDESDHLDKAAALKKRAERLAQLSFVINLVGMVCHYTPGIYANGYIVFVFPFVRLYVRSFVRNSVTHQSFASKFLKWCISQQLLIRKHSYLDHSYPGGLAFTP